MAKYVFLVIPGYGHVNPSLAVAQELVVRGDEVVYYLPDQFRSAVEASGASFRSYQSSFPGIIRDSIGRARAPGAAPLSSQTLPRPSSLPPSSPARYFPAHFVEESRRVLPQVLERVRAERPDFVVYDAMCLWARIVVGKLEVPAILLCPSYAMNEHSRGIFGGQFSQVMAQAMNSTMESLYFGVPMVAVPQMPEQAATARRVQELGLGLSLMDQEVTAEMLRDAVMRVAQGPAFRERVREMQRLTHEAGGYKRAAEAIRRFGRARARAA